MTKLGNFEVCYYTENSFGSGRGTRGNRGNWHLSLCDLIRKFRKSKQKSFGSVRGTRGTVALSTVDC